jgi:hypothetical protein
MSKIDKDIFFQDYQGLTYTSIEYKRDESGNPYRLSMVYNFHEKKGNKYYYRLSGLSSCCPEDNDEK